MSAEQGSARAFWLVLAVALALRVAWAALVPFAPVSDSNAYHVFARNLALSGVFGWRVGAPDAYWPPGAPFLYSLAYRVFGVGGGAVIAVNLALAAAKLALLWRLVARWFGARAALWTGWGLALWPTQIALTTVLSSEHPFDVALLAALLSFERSGPALAAPLACATGLALAAASYVRPTALPLGVGFALIAAMRGASLARCLRFALLTSAVLAVAIAPWALRNQRVFGRVVLISANGGANLWMGNNANATGGYMPLPREVRGLNTAERDAVLGAEAKRWIAAHPRDALRLAWRKLGITYGQETIGIAWNAQGLARFGERALLALKGIATAYWWGALAAAFIGVALRARAVGARGLLGESALALWVYFALVHAVTVGQDRYHLSAVPFIAAYAGLALTSAASQRLSRR